MVQASGEVPTTESAMQRIHTCTELTESALQVAQDNHTPRGRISRLDFPSPASTADPSVGRAWTPGSTLGVSFIGGSEAVRAKVKEYANVWTEHANIKFDFDAPHPATLRVAFVDEVGSWSFVGTSCESVPVYKPTTNLAWLHDAETAEETVASVVLHEFGHVLGCVHEHTPNVHVPWNVAFVTDYYQRTQGWAPVDVYRNALAHYDGMWPQIRAATFDPQSIMLQPIPGQFTNYELAIGWNSQLSEADKQLIKIMYASPLVLLDTGCFHTLSLRPVEPPVHENKATIDFVLSPSPTPPEVLLGLNLLSMSKDFNTRIVCDVLSVDKNSAKINLRSWFTTKHYQSACSWLAVSANDLDCQHGQYSVAEDSRHGSIPVHTSHRVLFAHPYPAIPKVAAWIRGIDRDSGRNLRCSVFATDISPTGFIIHLDTWGDSRLFELNATWLAYSADRTDIFSGSIDTELDRPTIHPKKSFAGVASFDGARFSRPPRVFTALSHLDVSKDCLTRVKITTDKITTHDMHYRIEAWAESLLYSARCTFIAIA